MSRLVPNRFLNHSLDLSEAPEQNQAETGVHGPLNLRAEAPPFLLVSSNQLIMNQFSLNPFKPN